MEKAKKQSYAELHALRNRGQIYRSPQELEIQKNGDGKAICIGLDHTTAGTNHFTMGYMELPPQTIQPRRWLHRDCEVGVFVLSGTLIDCSGMDAKQTRLSAGSFLYIPQGSIHAACNPSLTESTKLIFACAGINGEPDSDLIEVDDDPEIYPPKNWVAENAGYEPQKNEAECVLSSGHPLMNYTQIQQLIRPSQKFIASSGISADKNYEAGVHVKIGLNRDSVGTKHFTMGCSEIPPHSVSARHVHMASEVGIYVISGEMVDCCGADAKQHLLQEGSFMYIPEGSIHGGCNPNANETTRIIFFYAGPNTKEGSGVIQVEEDPSVYPPEQWLSSQK